MNSLLDTDTCVFALRGHASVRERLAAMGPDVIAISVITLAELYYGAACSARPAANQQAVNDFAQGITVLGVDPASAHAFGSIKAELRQKGALIDDLDILIAATARSSDLTLVTNNVEHFRRVSGLRLDKWV
ncbi:MAG: type II toxin-antitoxin system VapC family toxin [Anaerolineae bacterium]|nr:type II toxin-antitoxin system VapC family toxin [Anaerolineae bacterium]